jgi:RNA polymerase sigma-70 factor (ECF subfamily)
MYPRRELSDADLAELGADGDAAAQSEIFVRHKHGVARTIAALLGPDAEIEDLVHESFMRAYPRMRELESSSRLGAWLRGIAVLVSREWLKKKARRRWTLFEELPDVPATEISHTTRSALRDTFDVLSRLPVDERLAFSLRYIEGLEMEALALSMDMSVSTAKRRLRDAERRFRALAAKRPSLHEYLDVGAREDEDGGDR